MTLKNTREAYGSVAKWFHWLTALCFLMLYLTTYYRTYFMEDRRSDWGHEVVFIHMMFGWTALFILLPRIVWAVSTTQPDSVPGKHWEHLLAKAGHWGFYLLIFMMFMTGYMGTHDDTPYFYLFDIPKFQSTSAYEWLVNNFNLVWDDFEHQMDFLHRDLIGTWLMLPLIGLHVIAALYHHFFRRDTTLIRMVPGMKQNSKGRSA